MSSLPATRRKSLFDCLVPPRSSHKPGRNQSENSATSPVSLAACASGFELPSLSDAVCRHDLVSASLPVPEAPLSVSVQMRTQTCQMLLDLMQPVSSQVRMPGRLPAAPAQVACVSGCSFHIPCCTLPSPVLSILRLRTFWQMLWATCSAIASFESDSVVVGVSSPKVRVEAET